MTETGPADDEHVRVRLDSSRVLLSGGLGTIGSVCAPRLRAAGAEVVVNDVLPAADAVVNDGIGYVQGDGAEPEAAEEIVRRATEQGAASRPTWCCSPASS